MQSDSMTKNASELYYKTDAFKHITALNYCTYSLAKIVSYNDRVVLDNEYNNIINAINLKNIRDEQIITVLKRIMDTLAQFRLSEIEKDKLQNIYEMKSQQSILEIMGIKRGSKVTGILAVSSLIKASANAVSAFAASAAVASAASVYADYQRNMETYRERITDHQWNMTKDAIAELNELHKLVLETYWRILQSSDAPDEWRLTLAQFDALIGAGKEADSATRHRMLTRLEKDGGYIPAYWYYRAQAAHAAAKDEPSQKAMYAQDINKCVEYYEKYMGFLRKDELYASIMMLDITNNDYADNIVRKKLQHIIDHDAQDSSKRLFAALVCMERGFFDAAIEHLQANLDVKKFEVLMRKLMADALAAKQDSSSLQRLVAKTIEDDSASNQEVLYQLGKLSDLKALENFMPAIAAITVEVDRSLIGDEDLLLGLPRKWILANEDNMESTLTLAGRSHTPKKIAASKDGARIFLHFEKVLNLKAALAIPQGQDVSFDLMTEHFPVQLRGRLVPMDEIEEKKWFSSAVDSAEVIMNTTINRAKVGMDTAMEGVSDFLEKKSQSLGLNWIKNKVRQDQALNSSYQDNSPTALVFVLDEIRTTDACFCLDAERKLVPSVGH